MVGREVILRVDKSPAEPGAPLLTVEDLYVDDERGLEAVRGISFEVKAGEIVGIAGVDGNGQSELIDAITGLRRAKAGRISVGQRDLTHDSPRECLDRRRRPHPRGPPAARPRPRFQPGGEHRAARLPRGAGLEVRLALPGAADRARPHALEGVRRARRRPGDPCRGTLGRQPAEGDRRARGLARPERPRRCAADSGTRRRRDRVRPPPARRRAGRGTRPSCSSPSSSTRSCRSPTGSSSSTRGRSSPSTARTSPRRRSASQWWAGSGRRRQRERGRGHRLRLRDRQPLVLGSRRALHGTRCGRPRVLRRRSRRRGDRARPLRRLQGDLLGHRPELVLPLGTGRRALQRRARPPADAHHHGAAHAHGAGRRVRVPLRDVQHRRPGPVLRRPS